MVHVICRWFSVSRIINYKEINDKWMKEWREAVKDKGLKIKNLEYRSKTEYIKYDCKHGANMGRQ